MTLCQPCRHAAQPTCSHAARTVVSRGEVMLYVWYALTGMFGVMRLMCCIRTSSPSGGGR
jgi:hypothetical protein